MDGSALFLMGVIVGLVAGTIGTAVAFLRVLRTHYVVLEADMQQDLAEVLRRREARRGEVWVDPDPNAKADDPYLVQLLDRALALTDTQRMVVAAEIERLLAEYGRPVPGYESEAA